MNQNNTSYFNIFYNLKSCKSVCILLVLYMFRNGNDNIYVNNV